LIIRSEHACGREITLAKFIADNKLVFCSIIFVLGVILLTFGGSHWKNLITFLGFVAGFVGSLFIFYAFVKTQDNLSS